MQNVGEEPLNTMQTWSDIHLWPQIYHETDKQSNVQGRKKISSKWLQQCGCLATWGRRQRHHTLLVQSFSEPFDSEIQPDQEVQASVICFFYEQCLHKLCYSKVFPRGETFLIAFVLLVNSALFPRTSIMADQAQSERKSQPSGEAPKLPPSQKHPEGTLERGTTTPARGQHLYSSFSWPIRESFKETDPCVNAIIENLTKNTTIQREIHFHNLLGGLQLQKRCSDEISTSNGRAVQRGNDIRDLGLQDMTRKSQFLWTHRCTDQRHASVGKASARTSSTMS